MIRYSLVMVFICCWSLATVLEPMFMRIKERGERSSSVLAALIGDSRHLFANEAIAMADSYFHSGFYPTIFDNVNKGKRADLGGREDDPDDDDAFMGRPRDWVDDFGRHFYPTVHTHLHDGKEREILPWLKLSAELDPHQVEPYVTASYWLRRSLNKPDEAEQFLRQGLSANPDSPEILLELGRIDFDDRKNVRLAQNVLEMARGKWQRQNEAGHNPDPYVLEEILGEMVRVDRQTGDRPKLLKDLQDLLQVSKSKESIEKQIREAQEASEKH